jgi:hypothetical protein
MKVYDLEGSVSVETEEGLLQRLQGVRKGKYGAFILAHNEIGPLLHVHINGDFAYIHYFDDHTGENAGHQPTGMTPAGCPENVLFVQTDGNEGSGSAIEMPDYSICSVETAYRAAKEFLYDSAKPSCIKWTAL